MKKIAIIGGGTRACYLALACKKIDVETHCFSTARGSGNAQKFVDFFYDIDIFDTDGIISMCNRIGVHGVCATTELTILPTAIIAKELGLPGNPIMVASEITNKFLNREKIRCLDSLLSPKYAEVSSLEELKEIDFNPPFVIKPEALVGGKRGVIVVNNKSELDFAFKYAFNNVKQRFNHKLLIEEYISDGIECSVESLSFNGKHYIVQVTQKDTDEGLHCVELSHHQPANLSSTMRLLVEKAVTDGLSAIGLFSGPCHTEIKICNDKIYLIEFNARPGGDAISHPLIELSTGYNYMIGVAKIALGVFKSQDVANLLHRYSGIYYVTKQTKYLKDIFNVCDQYEWCYEKHQVSEALNELLYNDIENTNYFIYHSDKCNPVEQLLNTLK